MVTSAFLFISNYRELIADPKYKITLKSFCFISFTISSIFYQFAIGFSFYSFNVNSNKIYDFDEISNEPIIPRKSLALSTCSLYKKSDLSRIESSRGLNRGPSISPNYHSDIHAIDY